MVTKHLTDDEVQQYIADKKQCEQRIVEHVHICEQCKMNVMIYQSLIAGIKQQAQPAFDFDLSASVLKQLPVPQPKAASNKLLTLILIFILVGFLTGTVYYFRSYLANMFEGVAAILIYLIAISAITVIAALIFDMYKKYQKEMKVLDLY
jgi:ABC-type transport system involved in cytochrome bd biosynthesis fused ATPase/permease subunit